MLVVNGILKQVPTLFVGLNAADMRQLMNRQPIMMPTHIEIPEPRVNFQILMFGAETEEGLREHLAQLGNTVYVSEEEKPN